MNDEAVASFDAVIDQMTTGHLWLQDIIGPDVRVEAGWQVRAAYRLWRRVVFMCAVL